jgi:hypothetical protein
MAGGYGVMRNDASFSEKKRLVADFFDARG